MVLLRALCELAKQHHWHLAVAHLNHRLRGHAASADERLVRSIAERLKLPVVIERAEVRAFAQAQKLSLEMAGRQLRHEFLAKTALRLHIPTVALAHHADDQLELFFLRLLRGSGGEGLAGMKWRSPSPASLRVQLVRPLLDLSKADLRTYAAENQIRFREDVSNAWRDILRNRVRHELLPLLRRKYQPALNRTVSRSIQIIGAESDFVTRIATEYRQKIQSPKSQVRPPKRKGKPQAGPRPAGSLRLRGAKAGNTAADFDRLHLALQRATVRLQLLALGVTPTFDLIEWLREKPGQAIEVGSGTNGAALVRAPNGRVRFVDRTQARFRPDQLEVPLHGPAGGTSFAGVRFWWRSLRKRGVARPIQARGPEYFDADKVGNRVLLRHWRPGDRFQPIGLSGDVKLQDWFVNQKVAYEQRRRLVIAEAADGHIFWVEGQRISERFKLTNATIRRLQWRWERL